MMNQDYFERCSEATRHTYSTGIIYYESDFSTYDNAQYSIVIIHSIQDMQDHEYDMSLMRGAVRQQKVHIRNITVKSQSSMMNTISKWEQAYGVKFHKYTTK